jgi:5-hydroxyisourate hydrolase
MTPGCVKVHPERVTRLTTHVLDTAAGRPAAGIAVTLSSAQDGRHYVKLAQEQTDADGRVGAFPEVGPGRWRLMFETESPFFPEVVVSFVVPEGREHLHVPLLLSPYGYSVYRGS